MANQLSSRYALRLGLAPTRRNVFSKEDSLRFKDLIEKKLRAWGVDFVNIDWLNPEGLLYDAGEAPKVVENFRREHVDAIFCPHCNFGTEDAVAELGRQMHKPLLLWGPRDEAPIADGTRLRDTQCGLFATSKVLRRFNVPFTYIINSAVDDKVFERGLKNFMGAAAVVKAMRTMRIGQVDTRPPGFWTVICNEGELLERFNIKIVPRSLVEVVNDVKRTVDERAAEVKETVEDFKRRVDLSAIPEDKIQLIAGLKLVLMDWCAKECLSGVALQCWTALQDALGIMPCFVDSELTGMGLPVACETDVHGAITAVLLQAARLGQSPTFFADLTIRHPKNDNSELLWHCGPFPMLLAAEGAKRSIGHHYVLPGACPGVAEWRIRGGELTIARFDGDHGEYSMLLGHARGTEGPHTRGTYVWVEVKDWPLCEEKIIRGPYIHHVVGVHGQVAPVIYEACRYIPGLCPDPVEPTAAEIEAWLRGA